MTHHTMQKRGQAWIKLPAVWKTGGLVLIDSSAGTLVLCDVMVVVGGPRAGEVVRTPVLAKDVEELKPEN